MKRGKKYRSSLELIEAGKTYSMSEAIELVKKTAKVKFDATVDVSINFNVDTTKADQQIRGTLILPHGNGKTKRILAITNKIDEAKNAGADFVGGKEMIDKIKSENWFDYDVIVATPDMMAEIGKLGRLLGPKGLMPNPKTGTVSMDIAKAINEIKLGKVEYRLDKDANMNLSIGRVSFASEKILDNLKALMDTLYRVRPAAVKGVYIKSMSIHASMGPAVRFALN